MSLCENLVWDVIPSEARNLALSVFKPVRDSSSPAAPRNDTTLNWVLTLTLYSATWRGKLAATDTKSSC